MIEKSVSGVKKEVSENLLAEVKGIMKEFVASQNKVNEAQQEEAEYNFEKKYGKNWREDAYSDIAVKYFRAIGRRDKGALEKLSKALTGGDYVVPDILQAKIYEVATQYGIARKYATIWNMTSDVLNVPTASNDLQMSFTSAGSSYTEKNFTISEATLTAKKATGYTPINEETLADANVSLVNWITNLFANMVANTEDREFFTGDGTNFTGILNHSSATTVTLGSGDTTYASTDFSDLLDMQSQLSEGHDKNARYVLHKTVLNALRKKSDSNNRYLYQNPGQGVPGMIWDRPYVTSEVMPKTSDSSQNDTEFMVYGDLSHYALGIRQELVIRPLYEIQALNGKVVIAGFIRIAIAALMPTDLIVLKTSAT